ncbi:MAG: hypothetical protein HYV26_11800 [Candidatus Hydrogenedentes bacterium]|nr:hypothetical protein [Candidatus Hydrogenedentota bacterium]
MWNSESPEPAEETQEEEMLPDYDVDFSKSRPNRFAERAALSLILEPDLAKVFTTSEAVNKALRAILSAVPERLAHVQQ